MDTRQRIPTGVWVLGLVSLCTDLGSEMVHALLPVLVTGVFGASALTLGLIEGAAEGLVLVTKVFSGYLSDALGRRKPLLLVGYGLAAAAKPLFPLADALGTVIAARVLDRFGKGIRGAPRDALVAELAPAALRGASFGLRQSLDSVGAVLGPLLAIGLMVGLAVEVRTVLWIAVVPGVIAVALIVFAVREPPTHTHPPARLPITRAGLRSLGAGFWWVTAVGGLLATARASEAFLILLALEHGLPVAYAPLVLVVMSLTFVGTAYPAGRYSDRVPRRMVLVVGILVLVIANLRLATAVTVNACLVGAALWGVHLGLTQGVLASLVADTAAPAYRGTSFGVFNLVAGCGVLIASVLAGALWDAYGPATAFITGAVLAALAAGAALGLRRSAG